MGNMRIHVTQRRGIRLLTGTKQAAVRMAAVIVVLFSFMAVPPTTYADADGYAWWATTPVSIRGVSVSIPRGQLYHRIEGSGHHIVWQGANFWVVGNLCEPSMRFTYGWGSHKYDGDVHPGCSAVGQWKYHFNWVVPGGDACAELWAKNWRVLVAKQCHYIHDPKEHRQ